MTKRYETHAIEAGDNAAFIEQANQTLNEIKAVAPENLHCLLICAVTKDNNVKVGILGSSTDIAEMLMTVTTVARDGMVQANSSSNPTNEVLQ